jgi:hypothetical protein
LRRRPPGGEQLGRGGHRDPGADAGRQQLGQHEQLEQRCRLVGEPDVGVLGERRAEAGEHGTGDLVVVHAVLLPGEPAGQGW